MTPSRRRRLRFARRGLGPGEASHARHVHADQLYFALRPVRWLQPANDGNRHGGGKNSQSLQRGAFAEARRLIGLIAAADVQASALPRLRAGAESQDMMPPSQPLPGTGNNAVEAANAVAVQ